jgi:hypothetical protein
MDKMDVNQPLASGSKQSLAPAPASHTEERLGQRQSRELNEEMDQISLVEKWPARVDEIGDDDSQWPLLLESILFYLTDCLAATDLKDSVITNMNRSSARTFVKSLDNDMLEKWKAGVRSGVGEKDWSVLIPYRTCSSDCQMIGSHSMLLQ